MIQLILFLGIAALLLGTLVLLARRGSRLEGSAETLVDARQALTQLQNGLLAPELVARFIAAEDFAFVASAAPRSAYMIFRRERKRIVLSWLGQIRLQTRTLWRFHLGAARFYARMGMRSEISLAIDFASLVIACRALQVLVFVGGPRTAPQLLGATAAAGKRICEVYEEALAFLAVQPAVANRSIAS